MSVYRGKKLNIEISGRSHDERIFAALEGFPAGEKIDFEELLRFMQRRAPGVYTGSTARREADIPQFCSGICDGVTDGTKISLYIENTDAKRKDYDSLRGLLRPGHADLGAYLRYGADEDMSGGGRFSGRMTAPLCALGGIAIQYLRRRGVYIISHIASVSDVRDIGLSEIENKHNIVDIISKNTLPTISDEAAKKMKQRIDEAASDGDSLGGVIECAVLGFPAGMGGELFDGLESALAPLLFAIPAVKGVQFGKGFEAARLHGSENNDPIALNEGKLITLSNNCGGILGGISTGMPLLFSVAVKPTPSITKLQKTVNITNMTGTEISISGRHDACIVPRALPVVEAVTALALSDVLESENGKRA